MSNDKSGHQDSHRSLLKSTSVISLGTFLSRVLGFFRDIILAQLVGTGLRADAFFTALKIPNLLRDLVGEGAANSAVVPVFSEYSAKRTREEYCRFISVVLVLALIVLSLITILGVVLSPVIVRVMAPGFAANPEKFLLTVRLTRIIFPYLIFIGLTAYSMAILYTARSFVSPAFSPCLLNVAIIISAFLSADMEEPVYGLAWGVLAGGLLQLAVQIGPMLKTGVSFHIPKTLRHPGAGQVGKLLFPRLIGSGVYQMSVFIDTFCASLAHIVGPGGISAIYYSNRIIQFPMGIFSVALASAMLPALSGLVSNNQMEQMKKTVAFSLENTFFVMFPSSIVIMLLSTPIIRVLFERGEFDFESTAITSSALIFSALGLFSFGGIKILVTVFHALQDTKTPVKVAFVCLLLNIGLNFILMYPLKVAGIALASSVAATVDFLWLFHVLDKRLGGINSGLKEFVGKILVATLVTGACVYGLWQGLGTMPEALKLFLASGLGFVIYGVLCFQLNVDQARKIFYWATHKGSLP